MGKYHERKMGEGARKISVVQKSEPVYKEYFTYHGILFLSNKSSFLIQPYVDRIIFALIYLPFYLLIFCASWSSFSASVPFYMNQ